MPEPTRPSATFPARLDVDLEQHPSSATRARRAVRHLVGEDSCALDDLLLLTSELVTNAVVHADGALRLTGLFDPADRVVRVEVSDGSAVVPELAPPGRPETIGGHGLQLVDRIARCWGTSSTPFGKTVWFELDS